MSFLNPTILIGLVAVAIPIILHFVNFKREKLVKFSTLRLLSQIKQHAMKRFKIQQWLLMVLRCLSILFIILSFAHPTLEGGGKIDTFTSRLPVSSFLILDATTSMGYQLNSGESQWKAAQQSALKVLKSYSNDDELFISVMGPPDEYMLPVSILEGRRRILEARPTAPSISLESQIETAIHILSNSKYSEKEIVVISDFHLSGYLEKELNEKIQKDDSSIKCLFINISPPGKKNIAVQNVEVLTKIFEPGIPIKIKITLKNTSRLEKEESKIKLLLNAKLVAEKPVFLLPMEKKEMIFLVSTELSGFIQGEAKIDKDDLLIDNTHFFSFFIPQRINVLLVYNNEKRKDYFSLVLESIAKDKTFLITPTQENGLDSRIFTNYDYIIFSDPSRFTSNTIQKIQKYLEKGGGITICIPPDLTSYTSHNKLFQTINIGSIKGSISEKTLLSSIETNSEIFRNVFNPDFKGSNILSRDFLDVYQMVNYQKGSYEQEIVSTSSGLPLVTFSNKDTRKLIVVTTTLSAETSDIVFQPFLPPMLLKSIFISAVRSSAEKNNFILGERYQNEIALTNVESSYKVFKSSGEVFIPKTRIVGDQKRLIIDPSLFDETGVFYLKSNQEVVALININVHPTESEIRTIPPDTLKGYAEKRLHLTNAYFINASRDDDLVLTSLENLRDGISIWKMFLMLGILLLFAEMFLGRRTDAKIIKSKSY